MTSNRSLNDDVLIQCNFGHVVLDSRLRPEGDKIIGEGRAWHYYGNGKLVKDTGWEPTDVVLTWG